MFRLLDLGFGSFWGEGVVLVLVLHGCRVSKGDPKFRKSSGALVGGGAGEGGGGGGGWGILWWELLLQGCRLILGSLKDGTQKTCWLVKGIRSPNYKGLYKVV